MEAGAGSATLKRLYAGLEAHDADVSLAAFLVPGSCVADAMTSGSAGGPLAEALWPLCGFSWDQLRRKLPSFPRLLTAPAARDLQDALREDLARLFGPVLSVELGIAREAGDDIAPATLVQAALGSRDGLFELFEVYPALARLCAMLVDRWVGSVCDLLTRLDADRDALGAVIRGGPERQLAAVQWEERPAVLGRPELLLRFDGGEQVRYVPRPLPSHAAFVRLVDWLNACGAPHELRTARVLDRSTHAWVEHVEPQPCRDADDVRCFYERAGAWLFLSWMLRATDLGNQDLVACGSHPVLTRPRVLQHRLTSTPLGLLGHTVLSTGLVGSWRLIDRAFWDVSALPIGKRCADCRIVANWRGVDFDRMGVQFQAVPVKVTQHLPHLGDNCEPVPAHAEELVRGFRDAFAWAVQHREPLLREDSPLAELLRESVDFAAYDQPAARLGRIRSTSPRLLQDDAAHRAAAETHSLRLLSGICDELADVRPWLAAEARATTSLALLSLTADPGGTNIRVEEEDGSVWDMPGLLEAPSADDVRARIQGLDQAECEEQVRLLQILLAEPRRRATRSVPVDRAESPGPDWVKEAVALAERIVNSAARTACGAPTWLTVSERPSRGLYQPTPLPPEGLLSQGGLAIFLAAAGRVAGRADLRQHAVRALGPVRAWIFGETSDAAAASPAISPSLPNGAAYGVGSLILALTFVGRLTCDDSPIDDALALARHVSVSRIRRDTALDVYGGNAGLALALAALHDHTREAWIAPLLQDIGEHLLAHRVTTSDGFRAWSTSNGPPLGGFSHGAAGIAYALVRVFEVAGYAPALDAAREAIAYEHALFAPDRGQWRDLRLAGSVMCSWCHGAPGIALARASVLPTLDDTIVRIDLERAVQATLDWPVENLDHLCCGNAGRIECLWVAAGRLGSTVLRDAVLALAARVHAAAQARGRYAVDWPGTQDSPTFLRGLSGIGYQWLRLADPSLPSVLALA
jgi:type 2 lantibiotic biosynthesis protein LanM